MLLNNGFNSKRCGRMNFLELIAKIELYLSNLLVEQAQNSNNEKKMILFDKCPIDNIAFIEKDELTDMLKKLNTSYDEIINSFDLILHLETEPNNFVFARNLAGKKAVFLIQNMFPTLEKYIEQEYKKAGISIKVPKAVKEEIDKKTRDIFALTNKGIIATFTNLPEFIKDIKNEYKKY